jgi:hypothetical protein
MKKKFGEENDYFLIDVNAYWRWLECIFEDILPINF